MNWFPDRTANLLPKTCLSSSNRHIRRCISSGPAGGGRAFENVENKNGLRCPRGAFFYVPGTGSVLKGAGTIGTGSSPCLAVRLCIGGLPSICRNTTISRRQPSMDAPLNEPYPDAHQTQNNQNGGIKLPQLNNNLVRIDSSSIAKPEFGSPPYSGPPWRHAMCPNLATRSCTGRLFCGRCADEFNTSQTPGQCRLSTGFGP